VSYRWQEYETLDYSYRNVSKRNCNDTIDGFSPFVESYAYETGEKKEGKKNTSEKQKILHEIQGSVYIKGQLVTCVCLSLSSVLMRQDTEVHKRTRERACAKGKSKQ
jgi:hypothetical protein